MPIFNRNILGPFVLVVACALAWAWGAGWRLQITGSMPVGLYRLEPSAAPLHIGDLVAYCLPPGEFAEMARAREYLGESLCCPSGLRPLVKTIAGLPGDTVDVSALSILSTDSHGRRLSSVLHDGPIPVGFALLLSPHPGSFDSRYFGLVPLGSLRLITPLFTF